MARSVICIARSLGAGGEEAGRAVAEKLGYRYVDDEIIDRAAERAGVSRETITKAERPPGLLSRIVDGLAAAGTNEATLAFLAGAPAYIPAQREWSPQAELSYEELIQQVIIEIANQHKAVIMAHGAAVCLRGKPEALRVFVTASPETRAERLEQQGGMTRREAAKAVSVSDRARREYLWRFYAVRQESPTNYDLTLNTDALLPADAATIIMDAASRVT
jgi:cytidylate kinase